MLARPGMIPYAPDDILALRSYVATGGSLLVIVSPGWEPSQPANQNSLLWLFGVQADQEMEIRAYSTRIVPHAITESITQRHGQGRCELAGPARDRPDPGRRPHGVGGDAVSPWAGGRGVARAMVPAHPVDGAGIGMALAQRGLPRDTLPLENGQQRQLPLLVNVVRWLTEPRPDDEELEDRRKPFVEALAASMRVQFGVVPRETLKDPLKKLVAEAEAGIWKEEALWTAGEASLRWMYLGDRDNLGFPAYYFLSAQGPPQPVPEYYQRLIDEFPQSPLRPLAQWRLADCRRRQAIADRFKVLRRVTYADQGESIPLFEKVDAAKGTYPWAWARLWIGTIHAYDGRMAEAAAQFREVAEVMPTSPEKSIALLNLGRVLVDLCRWDEAARYYKAARDAPDNSWQRLHYNAWGPLDGAAFRQRTHELADDGLATIRRAAKK